MSTGDRLVMRKRIYCMKQWGEGGVEGGSTGNEDNDTDYVDIPVVTQMRILGTNGQIYKYRVENSADNRNRVTHKRRVKNARISGENIRLRDGIFLDVERIDIGNFLGGGLGQIFKHTFNNFDPAPITPEGYDYPAHFKTRYVRFNGTDGWWIDVEVLERIRIKGTNGQIFNYVFWPDLEDYYRGFGGNYGMPVEDEHDPYAKLGLILGYCDDHIALLPDDAESGVIDPPWRLDPFQNICNVYGPPCGVFVAGDRFGQMYSSSNGFSWSAYQTEMGQGAEDIIYLNGMFQVHGFQLVDEMDWRDVTMISHDGFNWSHSWGEELPEMYNFYGQYAFGNDPPFSYDWAVANSFMVSYGNAGGTRIHDVTETNTYPPETYGGAFSYKNIPRPGGGGSVTAYGGRIKNQAYRVYACLWNDGDLDCIMATKDNGQTWSQVATAPRVCEMNWVTFEEPAVWSGGGGGGGDCSPLTGYANGGGYDEYFGAAWDIQIYFGAYTAMSAGSITLFYSGCAMTIWSNRPSAQNPTPYSSNEIESFRNGSRSHLQNPSVSIYDGKGYGWYRNPSGTPCGGNWDGPDYIWPATTWNWMPPQEYVQGVLDGIAEAASQYPGGEWKTSPNQQLSPGIYWVKQVA